MRVLSNGRIRRSAEEWRTVLFRFRASGQDPIAFCRAEKITLSSFRRWQRFAPTPNAGGDFVPVVRVASPPASEREVNDSSGTSAWSLEVRLPNGVQLQFRG
ncbi:MAG: hypothetical protein IT349_20640 [Candidatus Eisenbacteria bacterium]|nr:hypothetical protein [Candidatus Eisenbacteria bacterium]